MSVNIVKKDKMNNMKNNKNISNPVHQSILHAEKHKEFLMVIDKFENWVIEKEHHAMKWGAYSENHKIWINYNPNPFTKFLKNNTVSISI
jgi:hypothetical protein